MKIQTADDVRTWAAMMVEAKGEKFTPLSKGEQYVIARYILSNAVGEGPKPEQDVEQDKGMPEPPPQKAMEVPPPKTQEKVVNMSRGAAFHCKGLSAQQAFDEFLKWTADHAADSKVMDFSTGKQSIEAAFSYWLHEVITVHFTGEKK